MPEKELNNVPTPSDYNKQLQESMKKLREAIAKPKNMEDIPTVKQDVSKQSSILTPTVWDKIKENLSKTNREKVIGPLVITYKQPAKIVEDGGNLT